MSAATSSCTTLARAPSPTSSAIACPGGYAGHCCAGGTGRPRSSRLRRRGRIPWAYAPARRAGTVHLGATLEEISAAEEDSARGRLPERPVLLVGAQYLADPTRSTGEVHPIWTCAHVPNGYTGDATAAAILDQIERFAPGTRDRVVATAVCGTTALAEYNPNYVGGDIAMGANTPRQILLRPRIAIDPYHLGIPGHYICSAATPPAPSVHGMCGANAARSALRRLGGRTARRPQHRTVTGPRPDQEPLPGAWLMSSPLNRICPAAGGRSPSTALPSVDLPEPLSPTTPTIWPAGTRRLTSVSAAEGRPAAAPVVVHGQALISRSARTIGYRTVARRTPLGVGPASAAPYANRSDQATCRRTS